MENYLVALLVVFFIVVCACLILVILIQRPQGGGLSGAFGGGSGSGQTAFGAKVGDVLTYATILIFVAFLLTAIGLNYALRPAAPEELQPTVEPAGSTPSELPAPVTPPSDDQATDEQSADDASADEDVPADDTPADDEGGEDAPGDDQSDQDGGG